MHYPWGKQGQDSLVYQLCPGEADKPFAELWYGAHSKAPSIVDGKPLNELIAENPEGMLGQGVVDKFGPTLPFLFKVLSIRTALSIQAHPNLAQAKELHAQSPEHYPDTNHKPEVTYALTPLELLHGFRDDIGVQLEATPELAELVGSSACNALAEGRLEEFFTALMRAPKERLEVCSTKLVSRLKAKAKLTAEESWVLRLYSGEADVGLFCFFVLQYSKLAAGEVVFTPPGLPHAYLSGDIIECMANSDNVLRAGLTQKHKDVENLLKITSYQRHSSRVALSGPWKILCQEAEEFELRMLVEGTFIGELPDKVSLVFSLDSGAVVETGESRLELAQGAAVLLPAGLQGSVRMSAKQGLFWALVP